MQKVTVIGSPGSGKSVLSRRIGKCLGLPVIHLDSHYWQAGWTPTPSREWDEFLKETSEREKWIIDGNYTRTLDIRLRAADAIVFLDMPRMLCLYRVFKRRIQYHGKTRPDLNEDCEEKLDAGFAVWVWNYKKNTRPKVLDALKPYTDTKEVIILRSRKEAAEFLDRIHTLQPIGSHDPPQIQHQEEVNRMSLTAEFKKMPMIKFEEWCLAAAIEGMAGDTNDFLQTHAKPLTEYDGSGYVYSTLLEYLAERGIDLEESEYAALAAERTEEHYALCTVLTKEHKQAYLDKLNLANYDENELGAYYNEFNDTKEAEAGSNMLEAIRVLQFNLREADETSVVLLILS